MRLCSALSSTAAKAGSGAKGKEERCRVANVSESVSASLRDCMAPPFKRRASSDGGAACSGSRIARLSSFPRQWSESYPRRDASSLFF
eukprot:scaffold265341_cov35-Tisochrysis_lutea.AAC.1